MAIKILISDPLAKEGIEILKSHKEFIVEEVSKLTEDDLAKKIKGYDALIIRSGTTVTAKIIEASDTLKVIGRAGVGVDNVDVSAASKKGIVVMNAPTGNTISTAEHAFSLMLSLSRNIPMANQSVKQGKWERKKFMGVELYGKVIGIVGLGRIGGEVAKRAQSFEMKVIAFDPYLSKEKAKSLNIESVDLDTLFQKSDFITVHTPLTDETKHLIGESAFKKMKKGVRIINAARGGIVDEKALAENIKSGKVAGAALDVFECDEEPPVDSVVIPMENIITTPHLGASTEEAQVNVAIDVAHCVSDALLGKGYRNAVNVPTIDAELLDVMQPYINLAERLGSIQAQLISAPIQEVNVKYTGEMVKLDTGIVTRALMKGVFDPILEEHVNYINSLFIAKERGIKVSEQKTADITDFANLICVEIKTSEAKHFIMGTLFSNKEPRIVKMDKFYVEAIPDGYMLVISNKDVPGIVGQIGTILGKSKVNIAGISFGRDKATGQAISLLNVDSEVSKEVLKALNNITDVNSVTQVKVGL
ncbi:D-3-phosphoglycerate dehydrogenase [Candidatus Omnitrophus magneticus]|uniref:D-3-phosphoglycerate dehydrogenase n=1 Tax=Candidatus Omnitrophus magneticus TaxID=1609969 RepID=A0A0F0CQS8_9BACT|nr:D-3-phosphoglycerate dehydrogenase [Candidatus Omnitrophus magneticus]